MTISPEFSRLVRLDTLGTQPRAIAVEADEAERGALALRFDLVALDRLEASAECVRDGDAVDVTGALVGEVIQSCVASGEPVPARIAEPFRVRFMPAPSLESDVEEMELSAGDCDIVAYSGGAVDLGEAVAETLALALDPFPRSPKAAEALRAAGVLSEEDAGPFAALKGLKDRLTRD
jgi:uncharacterized metal-binding protein YceD (DUF177 family)